MKDGIFCASASIFCRSANLRSLALALTAALAGVAAGGCGGPQTKMLLDQPLPPLKPDAKVDVYVGDVATTHTEVAFIESNAYAYVDDPIKLKQLDQLRRKAREVGANAVQDVHILTKTVRGYVADEKVPFPSLQQGEYSLYFMRGKAIRIPSAETGSLEALRPRGGWVIEGKTPPPRLQATVNAIPASPPVSAAQPAPETPAASTGAKAPSGPLIPAN